MSQCFLYNVQNDSPTRMDEREAFFRPASVFGCSSASYGRNCHSRKRKLLSLEARLSPRVKPETRERAVLHCRSYEEIRLLHAGDWLVRRAPIVCS